MTTVAARPGWRGLIEEYRDRLPVTDATPVVTLLEGATPLVPAHVLSELTGCDVHLKVEGANPTGSFKDRGMTMAISKAKEEGSQAVICASTGNTSASAAAYAARGGMTCAVLVPDGKIALGKLAQALVHGARLLQVQGNFDDCLDLCRDLSDNYPVTLVNSVNPYRIEGQKTAAFEIVDVLGAAPDIHCLPVGNAGNITAYWKGYVENGGPLPRMFGFQAAGAAPIVTGVRVPKPSTIATAIRIGNPASWQQALEARDQSNGRHPGGDRPADPVGLPAARAEGGGVRRAGVGRIGRRAAAGARGRPDRARPADRLHGHRQRPEGPRLGDRRRTEARHDRRQRRGRRRSPGTAVLSASA